MDMGNEEYLEYIRGKNLPELIEIKNNIDNEKHPERYQLIVDQINFLKNANNIATATNKNEFTVIGFWLRLLTDFIDSILLGTIGFLIAIPFSGLFNSLGENGLWIGLIITFLYTGILQSKIGRGQSIAKRLFNIEVVGCNGEYLTLPKSFLRYTVIALLFYNGWIGTGITSLLPFLNNEIFSTIYTLFMILLFFGVLILVPLHPLKRGIHDIISGSIVIKKGSYNSGDFEKLNSQKKIKQAYIISGVFAVTAITLSLVFVFKTKENNSPLSNLNYVYETISKESLLSNVKVNHNTFKVSNGKNTSINVSGFINKKCFTNEKLKSDEKQKIIEILKRDYKDLDSCNFIKITLRTGYNIGIWSNYYNENTSFNVDSTLKNGYYFKK